MFIKWKKDEEEKEIGEMSIEELISIRREITEEINKKRIGIGSEINGNGEIKREPRVI